MPLPSRKSGEERDSFIQRCMGNDQAITDFPDEAQRFAVCQDEAQAYWDKSFKRLFTNLAKKRKHGSTEDNQP